MVGFEVKAIIAHRLREGKTDYLVEWKDEKYANKWEFVEKQKMKCSDLLKAYTRKQEFICHWRSVLAGGAINLQKDLDDSFKPNELPIITDFNAVQSADLELPSIIGEQDVPAAATDGTGDLNVKKIFVKRAVKEETHLLCEMRDKKIRWVSIKKLKGNKILDEFYTIENIWNSEKLEKENTIDLVEEDESRKKRRRRGSDSSTSSKTTITADEHDDVSSVDEPLSRNSFKTGSSLECDYCKKTFSSLGSWSDHVRNHKQYDCFMCKKAFNWRSLSSHYMTKHKLKGRCCVCGVKTNTPAKCPSQCLAKKGKLSKKDSPE